MDSWALNKMPNYQPRQVVLGRVPKVVDSCSERYHLVTSPDACDVRWPAQNLLNRK